jgi:superfamily I DNA and/or RNA helicase
VSNLNKLNIAMEKHLALRFPHKGVFNEDLADWIFELSQVGSYYYGIATSGLRISIIDIKRLEEFEDQLMKIKVSASDELIYHECQTYLDSIKAILQAANDL